MCREFELDVVSRLERPHLVGKMVSLRGILLVGEMFLVRGILLLREILLVQEVLLVREALLARGSLLDRKGGLPHEFLLAHKAAFVRNVLLVQGDVYFALAVVCPTMTDGRLRFHAAPGLDLPHLETRVQVDLMNLMWIEPQRLLPLLYCLSAHCRFPQAPQLSGCTGALDHRIGPGSRGPRSRSDPQSTRQINCRVLLGLIVACSWAHKLVEWVCPRAWRAQRRPVAAGRSF